jgi:hypothetical protein
MTSLCGDGKSNSVVDQVEVTVVLSHEDISEDHVVEGRREGRSHKSTDAFSDTVLGDLHNVVFPGKDVVDAVNGEGDVWEFFDALAGSLHGDSGAQLVDEFLGSDDD